MFVGKYSDLTEKIIGAFFAVYKSLGYGFSEKVFENALALELRKLGLRVEQQKRIAVYHDGQVGEYSAGVVVNGVVIIDPCYPCESVSH